MGKLLIKRNTTVLKIIKCCRKYTSEIAIHNPAAIDRHYVVKAASLVHAKAERSVLHLIAEGKFHLVAVFSHLRASLYPLVGVISSYRSKKLLYLCALKLKLFLIAHRLVHAAPAASEMFAPYALINNIGFLYNSTCRTLRIAISHLVYSHVKNLTRYDILNRDSSLITYNFTFIRKSNGSCNPFYVLSFFHIISIPQALTSKLLPLLFLISAEQCPCKKSDTAKDQNQIQYPLKQCQSLKSYRCRCDY